MGHWCSTASTDADTFDGINGHWVSDTWKTSTKVVILCWPPLSFYQFFSPLLIGKKNIVQEIKTIHHPAHKFIYCRNLVSIKNIEIKLLLIKEFYISHFLLIGISKIYVCILFPFPNKSTSNK